jgi:hypothetical protein
MIRQKIYLPKYDWTVYCYYAVSEYYVDDIMTQLWEIGCDGEYARRAYENLSVSELDTGLTYSNSACRETVMVVGMASSAEEFFNSLLHELRHVEAHIASACHLNPNGEEVAYLCGELGRSIYPKVKHLLCDCCRKP